MKVDGAHYRSLWVDEDGWSVRVIDQRALPHRFETVRLQSLEDAAKAIREMTVRGAPLIGATAAYGLCLALRRDPSDAALEQAAAALRSTRPTAVDLANALAGMQRALAGTGPGDRAELAYRLAGELCEASVAACRAIGRHGAGLLRALATERGAGPLRVLTHCNAGWLATVDHGTALAPIYAAHDAGIPLEVWVDETRPRAQGAKLTAWELGKHGIPHTLVVDGAAGHLMQSGRVDACLVGADRVTRIGDVCNKIGTYGVALAARDNAVPFYCAFPATTIDWTLEEGLGSIPIEERDPQEVLALAGRALVPAAEGREPVVTVGLAPAGTPAANFAFDVTPARLVSGFVTEHGVCPATPEALSAQHPEAPRAGHAGG